MNKPLTRLMLCALFSLAAGASQAAGIVFSFGAGVTAERQAAFQAAANEIQQLIQFRHDINVSVSFKALSCSNSSAVLGFAGPDNININFSGAPQSNIWYVSAMAADYGHPAAMDDVSHITGEFNSNLGNAGCLSGTTWYYGADHNPGFNQVDFVATAVHEFMHGLGFISFNDKNGANADNNGTSDSGHLDAYSALLKDNTTGKRWTAMTDAERAASILKNGNLVWDGAKATAMDSLLQDGITNGKIRMYAPSSYENGSSTSHVDKALFYKKQEHEVMEPVDESPQSSVLSIAMMCDIGWHLLQDSDADGINDCEDNLPLSMAVDTDGDGVVDTLDAFPNNPAESVDTDHDGTGNNADTDDDNDGVADAGDNCPLVSNPSQKDFDSDGTGDDCGDPVPLPGITGVAKKDNVGNVVAFAGDLDKDGYGDYVVGIPHHDVVSGRLLKDAGQVQVISGRTGGVLFSREGVAANDQYGAAVAGAGFVDGDTFLDVVVGAPGADDVDNGIRDAGSVTVFYGPDGTKTPTTIFGAEVGVAAKAQFGAAVALGDIDNNNLADVIVGAPKEKDIDNGLPGAGSVTVIDVVHRSVLARYRGQSAGAAAGTSVVAANTQGTGVPEVIVGAPKDGGTGSVTIYSLTGEVIPPLFGAGRGALFGKSLAAGLINADGCADVVVGAPGDDDLDNFFRNTGSVTVFSGCSSGTVLAQKYGATVNAALGSSVAAGDIDGDGLADILAGASKDDNPDARAVRDAGSVSVWSGDGSGLITTLYGSAAADHFGSGLAAGDINGDGKADLMVGAGDDDSPLKDAGSLQLFSGQSVSGQ